MSLRRKILLPLISFTSILVLYLYGYWMPHSLANMENGYVRSIERHLDSVAEGLVPLLKGHQLDTIYENLDSLMKNNRDWISLQLVAADGKPLYPLEASPPAAADNRREADIHIVTRRISHLDTGFGNLILTVDFAPRLSDIRKRHWELIFVMLGMIVFLTAALGFVVDRLVRRPVNLLAQASQRLAEGDFDVPLVKVGNDEVGLLVDRFDAMRTAIREYRSTLQSAHAQLQSELSERKRAEVFLRESETRLKEAQRLAHLGHWELDLQTNALSWSDEVYRIFGLATQEFGATFDAFLARVHPEDREFVARSYAESVKNKTWYDIVHRVVMKNGDIKYVNERCTTDYDENGVPLRSLGTVLDITERKQAEESLRKLTEELEQRVSARTAELLAKNEELERVNRLFVGRELRMIELKERIRTLEQA